MRTVAIIQARMSSTRLPGKVLTELAGRPMLAQQLRQLRQARRLDELVVATTANADDDPVVDLCRAEQVRWFRGSEHDVLARYVGAARESSAELVVRLTADCPLLDASVVDRVVEELSSHAAEQDYASNVVRRCFPRGLDTEALFQDTLLRVDRMARSTAAREHVTYLIVYEHPEWFRIGSVEDETDNSDLRWTVDVPEDLELVRRIYEGLGLGDRTVDYREVLAYVRSRPDLMALNATVVQKAR